MDQERIFKSMFQVGLQPYDETGESNIFTGEEIVVANENKEETLFVLQNAITHGEYHGLHCEPIILVEDAAQQELISKAQTALEKKNQQIKTIKQVLPALADLAAQKKEQTNPAIKASLQRQYQNCLQQLSPEMRSLANDFLRIDKCIYRLTEQNKIVAIDLSEITTL